MGERLEEALKRIDDPHYGDFELRDLRRKAHELQQDVTGLTAGQVHRLEEFDGFIHNEPIISDFDREQEAFLPTSPKQEIR